MSDKYDIEFLQPAANSDQRFLTFTHNNRHSRVSGIQKVIQRYINLFLTPKGANPLNKDVGSEFMLAFDSNSLTTVSDIPYLFAISNISILDTLMASDNNENNIPEESIASANLLDYSIDRSQLKIYLKIQITTKAGEAAVANIPIGG